VTYFGHAVVFVVDLTGSVRIGQIPRREVEQSEVDALARLGDQFDRTRRHAVGQSAHAVRRRRGRCVAVRQDGHSAATAGWSLATVTPWNHATNEAKVSGYRLLSLLQTLVVIR